MIHLTLTDKPIDEVEARLAVVTFFEDMRPLKGQVGLLDWRLNGRISQLIQQKRIEGQMSEALIMPSAGRMTAPDILLLGLGNTKEMTDARIQESFLLIVDKVCRLKPSDIVLSFGDLVTDFMGWRSLLRTFVSLLSDNIGNNEIVLHCSDQSAWVSEARRRNMDFGAAVNVRFDDEMTDAKPRSYVA